MPSSFCIKSNLFELGLLYLDFEPIRCSYYESYLPQHCSRDLCYPHS